MKSPRNHTIVQIEITNACSKSCSNCTRFCGHHKAPFFMDFETFKAALDSMKGHPGMIGIMGGEPTLHPEFERFIEYYSGNVGARTTSDRGRHPIADFGEYICDQDLLDRNVRRGLWTSLGPGYYRHFELIQEVFDYQCINDHEHDGLHQALLVSRTDLGIGDEEWEQIRDRCWIQNMWSSSITPRGAFFCEVAAALDTLFDGPGGWPIERGWWEREPKDFGTQLDWCEMCGGCLAGPQTKANLEIDTVSPSVLRRLKEVRSPKIAKGRFQVLEPEDLDPASKPTPWSYIPEGDHRLRVGRSNRDLLPRTIDAVVVANPLNMDLLRSTLEVNRGHFDDVVVVGPTVSSAVRSIADQHRASLVEASSETDTLGVLLNRALAGLASRGWILLLDDSILLSPEFRSRADRWIFNPGCLYRYPVRSSLTRVEVFEAISKYRNTLAFILDASSAYQDRSFDRTLALFHPRARSVRGKRLELYHPDAASLADSSLSEHWPDHKIIALGNLVRTHSTDRRTTLFHGHPTEWEGVGR